MDAAASVVGGPAPMPPAVVLVAGGPDDRRAALHRLVEAAGHRPVDAADAEAAVAALRTRRPDAAVVDAALLGDPALGAALGPSDHGPGVPTVVVTGAGVGDQVAGAATAGGHDVLRTPLDPAEAALRVAAAVREGSLRRALERREQELELLSRTDPLTGLYNRRHLDEQLRALAAAAFRHGHLLGALMVDIDEFRRLNESEGRVVGDAVLCVVAARLRSAMRVEDVLGRWGGEEFVVLMPFTDEDDGVVLAERLRARVGGQPIGLGEGVPLSVTVSVGVAAGDGSDPEALLRGVDVALYRAKQAGRDRVERAGAPAPAPRQP